MNPVITEILEDALEMANRSLNSLHIGFGMRFDDIKAIEESRAKVHEKIEAIEDVLDNEDAIMSPKRYIIEILEMEKVGIALE